MTDPDAVLKNWPVLFHTDFDPDQDRDERGRWTSGGGSGESMAAKGEEGVHPGKGYSDDAVVKDGVIHTSNVDDAARALFEDKKVNLNQPREAATLIDKLGKIAAEMVAKGEKEPKFNLCNVSVTGTNLFCAESKGIPRIEMPQLTDEQTAQFQDHLAKSNYKVEKGEENAAYLRATQNELIGAKVAGTVAKLDKDYEKESNRRVIVSKDNYILDGHHFWAGMLAYDLKNNVLGDDKKMKVARIDIGIIDLLEQAEKFTGGKGKKGGDESAFKKKDHAMGNLIDRQFMLDNHKCPACGGTGEDDDGNTCPECDGEGYVEDKVEDGKDVLRTVQMYDTAVFDGKPRKTSDGYLVANARIARTGIQHYSGRELGMPHMDQVRVYRPPSEVFNKKAMHSLAGKPLTLNHPPEMVDASNWEKYSIGSIGEDVVRDGEFIRVPMVIMDAQAIAAYEKHGVKELSVGYSTDLKWGKGKTPDGEVYDAKQTAIRGNHLAVVPAARGGSLLRIGDIHQKGDTDMVKVLIDGQTIEFGDELTAKHVTSHIAALQKVADEFKFGKKKAEEEQEEEKKLRAEKDALSGEVVALKKQLDDANTKLSDAVLDKMIEDRIDLRTKAFAAMDGKADFTGKSPAEIRRIVVDAKMGEAAKTLTDGEVIGAFKALTADVKPRGGVDRLADSLSMLQHGGGSPANDPKALRDAAYDEYVKRLTNDWKPRAAS